jgi:bifunctional DNA-binding transcriptional regulator/antitoxin component of YhaV-PrlF toxin-antitoxin module
MRILASDEGEVVIPVTLSAVLGIRPGEPVNATLEGDRIVIAAPARVHYEGKIIADPETGFPVLDFGPDAPVLTSEMVAEMMAEFP